MAVYPGAVWRPIGATPGNRSNGKMRSYRGAVLHVNQSNGNLFNFFKTNPAKTSAHFEVYKTGVLEQFIDTSQSSWCQSAGNDDWISIETEGYDTEPLTQAQMVAIAGLYGWLHATHGIPLQVTDTTAGSGFIFHGAGGTAWGGHPACPGDLRKPQRQLILNLLKPAPAPPKEDDDMANLMVILSSSAGQWVHYVSDGRYIHLPSPVDVQALVGAGAVVAPGLISDGFHAELVAAAAKVV